MESDHAIADALQFCDSRHWRRPVPRILQGDVICATDKESNSGLNQVASLSRSVGKTRMTVPIVRGSMNAELDYDLSPDQWETLKALRIGAIQRRAPAPFVIAQLLALGLVASDNHGALITPMGRKVLIRGSSRLWDVAA
jgi:hypothetical protein